MMMKSAIKRRMIPSPMIREVINELRRFAGAAVHGKGRKWGVVPKW
jgi:hypothetical protein